MPGGLRADPGGRQPRAQAVPATWPAGSATRSTLRSGATSSRRSATPCAGRPSAPTRPRQENVQLKRMVNLDADQDLALSTYKPVTATGGRALATRCGSPRSPSTWARATACTTTSPWSTAPAWSARSPTSTADAAIVTLITDHSSGVSAKVPTPATPGSCRPRSGNPNDLLLQFLPPKSKREGQGEAVVTGGTKLRPRWSRCSRPASRSAR